MKNMFLDLIMGIITITCIVTIIGLIVIEEVLKTWKEMRK